MITNGETYTVIDENGTAVLKRETLFGLSTDDKPTTVGNGSAFVEMDTGKLYFFDAENTTWGEWGA